MTENNHGLILHRSFPSNLLVIHVSSMSKVYRLATDQENHMRVHKVNFKAKNSSFA